MAAKCGKYHVGADYKSWTSICNFSEFGGSICNFWKFGGHMAIFEKGNKCVFLKDGVNL